MTTRARIPSTLVAAVLLAAIAGCENAPPILGCPALVLDGWTWIAVVGPPGTVGPFERVELRVGDETMFAGVSYATESGSFAVRGARRMRRGDRPVLVSSSGARFSVLAGESEALISYPSGSRPVVEGPPGIMTFSGWLERTPSSSRITRAWAFDWSSGEVTRISSTPTLGVPITGAEVHGGLGHCLAIFSEHEDGGSGGCWWPYGGGCLCHHCTLDDEQAGRCVEPAWQPVGGPWLPCGCNETPSSSSDPDTSGREPLPVSERRDPPADVPPQPSRGPSAPVGSGTPPPDASYASDAWWAPLDAWSSEDAGPPGPPF